MISEYVETLKEYNSNRKFKANELKNWKAKRKSAFSALEDLEEALVIFQATANVTQTKLAEDVGKIVTKAIRAVFLEDDYSFKVVFEKRRNTTECDLFVVEDGKDMKPLEDCGYGIADIVSIALRVAFWKLDGKSRNTFILDEPTRNLDWDRQHLASEMIRRLSAMGKGIQFIIVTHKEPLTEGADRVFRATKGRHTSTIKRVRMRGKA